MIRRLVSKGLVRLEGRVACDVNIRLRRFLVNLRDSRGHHYHLRMTEQGGLEEEYQQALSVADAYARFVLRPVGFERFGTLSCIVFDGVECSAIGEQAVLRSKSSDVFVSEVLEFFALSVRTNVAAPACMTPAGVVGPEVVGGEDTVQAELFRRVLRVTDVPGMMSLPRVAQHGDFVLNNLVVRDGQLLVLDWEDFGKVSTPGFDLAILLCSALDYDPARVGALAGTRSDQALGDSIEWLDDALRTLDLERGAFFAALPFHLFRFLELKKGYSPAIRHRVSRALESLL